MVRAAAAALQLLVAAALGASPPPPVAARARGAASGAGEAEEAPAPAPERLRRGGRLGAAFPPPQGPGAPAAPFRDVWNRSFCRPLEQLVDVAAEFPGEVQDVFRPSCVALQRCGGCCGDEGLRCVPLESRTLRVQLLRIKPSGEAPYVEMAFTEHKRCACRPRQDPMKAGRRRSKGRGKRRQNKKRRKDCALCGTPRR